MTILHERLASPEEAVMTYLKENDSITNSIGRKVCHIPSENVMKRVFERLIRTGQVERIPELRGRNAAYRLKATPSPNVDVDAGEYPEWQGLLF